MALTSSSLNLACILNLYGLRHRAACHWSSVHSCHDKQVAMCASTWVVFAPGSLGLFPLCQFPLYQFPHLICQFPFGQLPTLSIPIWSMLMKWELTKWELMKWELTKWEVDEVGRFTILYTSNHCYRSVSFLVYQYNLTSADNKTVWCPCVW